MMLSVKTTPDSLSFWGVARLPKTVRLKLPLTLLKPFVCLELRTRIRTKTRTRSLLLSCYSLFFQET